jgi:hypothetical protein
LIAGSSPTLRWHEQAIELCRQELCEIGAAFEYVHDESVHSARVPKHLNVKDLRRNAKRFCTRFLNEL